MTFKEAPYEFRGDGRIEFKCEHGVGHTIHVPKEYEKQWAWWSHGCDGCCFGSEELTGESHDRS